MKNILRAKHAVISELPVGSLPDWIQLLPGKGEVKTRDGRGPYFNKSPEKILAAFEKFGMPLPGDYEHQSMTASEKTQPTGASGWIEAMEVRGNGEIWGKVKWTEKAAAMIAAGEYRYISPVFDYNAKTGEIAKLVSFGLTNNPNLFLRAAAKQQGDTMSLYNKIHKALSALDESANDADVMKAMKDCMSADDGDDGGVEPDADDAPPRKKVKVAEHDTDDPDATPTKLVDEPDAGRGAARFDASKYVPMSMYKALEAKVNRQDADLISRAVNAAVKAGKITPAQRKWATAYATQDLNGFNDFVSAAPAIVNATTTTEKVDVPTMKLEDRVAMRRAKLSDEERRVNRVMGVTDEAYCKSLIDAEDAGAIRSSVSN